MPEEKLFKCGIYYDKIYISDLKKTETIVSYKVQLKHKGFISWLTF